MTTLSSAQPIKDPLDDHISLIPRTIGLANKAVKNHTNEESSSLSNAQPTKDPLEDNTLLIPRPTGLVNEAVKTDTNEEPTVHNGESTE